MPSVVSVKRAKQLSKQELLLSDGRNPRDVITLERIKSQGYLKRDINLSLFALALREWAKNYIWKKFSDELVFHPFLCDNYDPTDKKVIPLIARKCGETEATIKKKWRLIIKELRELFFFVLANPGYTFGNKVFWDVTDEYRLYTPVDAIPGSKAFAQTKAHLIASRYETLDSFFDALIAAMMKHDCAAKDASRPTLSALKQRRILDLLNPRSDDFDALWLALRNETFTVKKGVLPITMSFLDKDVEISVIGDYLHIRNHHKRKVYSSKDARSILKIILFPPDFVWEKHLMPITPY